jgi:hypothetical protein
METVIGHGITQAIGGLAVEFKIAWLGANRNLPVYAINKQIRSPVFFSGWAAIINGGWGVWHC